MKELLVTNPPLIKIVIGRLNLESKRDYSLWVPDPKPLGEAIFFSDRYFIMNLLEISLPSAFTNNKTWFLSPLEFFMNYWWWRKLMIMESFKDSTAMPYAFTDINFVCIWNSLEFSLNSWRWRKLMTTESFKNSAANCFSYEMSLEFFMNFGCWKKAYDNRILPRISMRKLEGFSFLAICTKLQKNFQIWNVFKVID